MKQLLPLSLSLCLMTSCGPGTPNSSTSGTPAASAANDSALEQELNTAERLSANSAQLSVTQARNVFFPLTGRLPQVPLDVSAYASFSQDVTPPMLAAANSLVSGAEDAREREEYRTLFNDMIRQLLSGINNNLTLYQGLLESTQVVPGGIANPTETFEALTGIFQATEYTERFLAQLGQFPGLLPDSVRSLQAIQNQQAVVNNGVLKTLEQVNDVQVLAAGYRTLIETLTRPALLAVLTTLATRIFGAENVALRQPVITPVQTNPNPTEAVIRESADQYRVIKVVDGRLDNQLVQDSRGLSAADFLNNTTVVQVQNPAPTGN